MSQTCITGYHGTGQAHARDIIRENKFKNSESAKEWLGCGVYFFEDRNHAIGWANIRARRENDKYAVVLAADISFDADEIFDLDIPRNIIELEKFCEKEMQSDTFKRNGAPHFKTHEEQRCFWADFYKETHPNIKVMAYTFDSTERVISGFPFKQRQLCVNNHSAISNIRCALCAEAGRGGYYRG